MKKFIWAVLVIASISMNTSNAFACDCDKNKKGETASGAVTAATTAAAPAGTTTTPSFDSLKKLAGTWETKIKDESGKEQTGKATYEVTSGGHVVAEKIFVGTAHEMLSVYSDDGKEISMTHYCMLPNAPRMTLQSTTPGKMYFKMKGKDGIRSKKEHHMDSVELVWNGENEFTQYWSSVKDGKKSDSTIITWKRIHTPVAKK